ncbi:MAG TPA: hypothetical protein VIW46_11790, partial [Acidimicrobiia bacterium]
MGKRLSELKPLPRAVIVGLAAAIAVLMGGFVAFRVLGSGSVLGDVRVLGAELGGSSEIDAAARVD